jgi:hypothetical protein
MGHAIAALVGRSAEHEGEIADEYSLIVGEERRAGGV